MMSVCLLIASCSTEAKKGEPTAIGEPISIEQIEALPQDSSRNGELVSIEGYAMSCSMLKIVNIGKSNSLTLRTSPDCKDGKDIITINILFDSVPKKGMITFGSESEETRNYFIFNDDKTFSVMTDDYQKIIVNNTKLIFSGKLQYDSYIKRYELNVVSIHTVK